MAKLIGNTEQELAVETNRIEIDRLDTNQIRLKAQMVCQHRTGHTIALVGIINECEAELRFRCLKCDFWYDVNVFNGLTIPETEIVKQVLNTTEDEIVAKCKR